MATKVSSAVVEESATTITGEIRMWAAAAPPAGWLDCDGSAKDAVADPTLQPLFDIIGNTYGGADNTDFKLPDFRGRIPVGVGTGDAANPTAFALADKDGDEVHTLTTNELASHSHGIFGSNSTSVGGDPGATFLVNPSNIQTVVEGGDAAHNNLQPSLCIHFIIKK